METQEPPIRVIAPGRVFRNEAISARSHCIFHQIEGLYVDKDVSFAEMKQTLLSFATAFFGDETKNPSATQLLPVYGAKCRSGHLVGALKMRMITE